VQLKVCNEQLFIVQQGWRESRLHYPDYRLKRKF